MLTEKQLAKKLKTIKPFLTEKYFVKQIGYFGSYASGMATEASDIDILVEFGQPVGFEFFRVQDFLEETLGKKVDLLTPNAVRPQLKESIYQKLKFV